MSDFILALLFVAQCQYQITHFLTYFIPSVGHVDPC